MLTKGLLRARSIILFLADQLPSQFQFLASPAAEAEQAFMLEARERSCLGCSWPSLCPALKGQPFSQVPWEPAVWAMAQPVEFFYTSGGVFLPQGLCGRKRYMCFYVSVRHMYGVFVKQCYIIIKTSWYLPALLCH